MRLSYRIITTAVRWIEKLFWGLQVIHPERLENISNCIIAANHISAVDPPFIGSIMPIEIFYLAKAELFEPKPMGMFFKFVNCIPIKRGRIDKRAITTVKMVLRKGNSLLLFPEGTRKSAKVKSGVGKFAIETGKDVLPIYIENSTDFWGCFFRKKRLKIYIGERMNAENYKNLESVKENYHDLAHQIMNNILELKK